MSKKFCEIIELFSDPTSPQLILIHSQYFSKDEIKTTENPPPDVIADGLSKQIPTVFSDDEVEEEISEKRRRFDRITGSFAKFSRQSHGRPDGRNFIGLRIGLKNTEYYK